MGRLSFQSCPSYGRASGVLALLPSLFIAAVGSSASDQDDSQLLSAAMISTSDEGGEGSLCLLQLSFSPTSGGQPLGSATVWPLEPVPVLLTSESTMLLHMPYDRIAVNLTYHSLGEEILTFPKRRPCPFSIILATVKTWAADAVVQTLEQRRGSAVRFDWHRSAVFLVFGFLYVGAVQWVLYVSILTWIFPDAVVFANSPWAAKLKDGTGQMSMLGQVFVDNFLFEILIYFPAFYIVKALIQERGSLYSRVETGLSKYWKNIVADNLVSCAVWVPADLVIFAMPMYLRMPLEHSVSFGWTMFISAMRGATNRAKAKSER